MAPLRGSVLDEPAARTERFGAELSAWLRGAVIVLIDDPDTLTVVPRWKAPQSLVLLIRAARGGDVGRIIGRRGAMLDALRTMAVAAGARHGLCLRLEVDEA